MNSIMALAAKLQDRGLDVFMETCSTGTGNGHYDAMTVTNPREPKRGFFHVGTDGAATWDYPAPDLDDSSLPAEIANALRLNGLPKRVKP
jgi:hypothetical protein